MAMTVLLTLTACGGGETDTESSTTDIASSQASESASTINPETTSVTSEASGTSAGPTGATATQGETTDSETTAGQTTDVETTDSETTDVESTDSETDTDTPDPCLVDPDGLLWPLDCRPGESCWVFMGNPDIDSDGTAYDCGAPGYFGHQGTDMVITEQAMLDGITVRAAGDAEVVFVFDQKHDRCDIDLDHPDCLDPGDVYEPGLSEGVRICTDAAPEYCQEGVPGSCFWCFDGGNVIVLEHLDSGFVFATRYDHIQTGSAMVELGEIVPAGSPIALAASAGRSTAPHLHFEVWDSAGWYSLTEPWSGACSPPGHDAYLFARDPAWCEVP